MSNYLAKKQSAITPILYKLESVNFIISPLPWTSLIAKKGGGDIACNLDSHPFLQNKGGIRRGGANREIDDIGFLTNIDYYANVNIQLVLTVLNNYIIPIKFSNNEIFW